MTRKRWGSGCAPWVHSGVECIKRFTDTQKWDDPWFWELSPTAKLLWFYLLDHCDNSGAVDYNPKIASFKIGEPVKPEHLAELQSRLKTLQSGKLWITKFIRFQFGSLEPTNNPHRSILKLLSFHGLKYPEDTEISSPCQGAGEGLTSPPRQGKDKVRIKTGQERVQGEGGKCHKDSRAALQWLNAKSGNNFRETDTNLSFISQRLSEPGVDLAGVTQMIDRQCQRWKGTPQADYLRPETLFNKTKFDGYYATRTQPVTKDGEVHNKRLDGVAPGVTNYGEAAKRKMERQTLEAANRPPPQT